LIASRVLQVRTGHVMIGADRAIDMIDNDKKAEKAINQNII